MDNELIFLIGLVSFLTGCSFTCLAFDSTKKKDIPEFEAWERVNNKNFKGEKNE